MCRLYHADARALPLADGSVHAIVTSPPYFNLRSYGYAEQIGLEATPEAFIAELLKVFRECKRVLRADGTMWVNMGDSYGGSGKGQLSDGSHAAKHGEKQHTSGGTLTGGLPPKHGETGNLLGIPWRLAFALQDDGWILREEVVWVKAAPMPESLAGTRWEKCRVKLANGAVARHGIERGAGHVDESDVSNRDDGAQWADCPGCPKCADNDGLALRRGSWRHTSATESVFMFAKQMGYYSDQEAVRETGSDNSHGGGKAAWERYTHQTIGNGHDGLDTSKPAGAGGRNPRNVLTLGPEPFLGGNHFATYPRSLVRPLIQASTSERGCCPRCGSQWARVICHKNMVIARSEWGQESGNRTASSGTMLEPAETQTLGWKPTCACKEAANPVPATVLDPFAGTATTCVVAQEIGRASVGVELSEAYLQLAIKRLSGVNLPLPLAV